MKKIHYKTNQKHIAPPKNAAPINAPSRKMTPKCSKQNHFKNALPKHVQQIAPPNAAPNAKQKTKNKYTHINK